MPRARFDSRCRLAAEQSGARRHGIAGIYGICGILESVTYKIQRVLSGSNPTLSAPKFSQKLLRSGTSAIHVLSEVAAGRRRFAPMSRAVVKPPVCMCDQRDTSIEAVGVGPS